ncbi:PE family protein [Mycobacterium haemophilum DSM 44634]|uniref:PE family protein n=1 Tax=Mycobacterium haemophilum TaxID=29311 RepID=UPI0006564EAD|nr:PE family protein [Mycobacterium haemophilum]AKN15541.1 hypothetical protein B586_01560 [Mycobacterium haemophilum DSM 44634]MCV7342595.1 PE family protein [Mycobacterium haemophilum DSM 44634]
MPFLITAPGVLATAAGALRDVGDRIDAASAAAGKVTGAVLPMGRDEVSAYAAEQLRTAAADYHMVMGGGSVTLELFLTALAYGEERYSEAEASNAKSCSSTAASNTKSCALM